MNKSNYHALLTAALLSVPCLAYAGQADCQGVRQQLATGNVARAGELLDNILSSAPCHGEALALKGRILAAADDLDGALVFYEKALACHGELPRDNLLEIATAFSLVEKNREAIGLMEGYLAKNGQDVEFIHELGLSYLAGGQVDKACNWLAKGQKLSPGDLVLATDYGACLLYQGQENQAVSFLEKLTKDHDGAALPRIFLGDAYMVKKEWDKAFNAYNKAVLLEPENEMALFRRARFYQKKEEWDKAAADFKRLLNSSEYQVKALNAMVDISIAAGDTKVAQKWLEAAKKYQVISEEKSIVYQAEIFRLSGDIAAAKKLLMPLVANTSDNKMAWSILLAIAQEDGDKDLQRRAEKALRSQK